MPQFRTLAKKSTQKYLYLNFVFIFLKESLYTSVTHFDLRSSFFVHFLIFSYKNFKTYNIVVCSLKSGTYWVH